MEKKWWWIIIGIIAVVIIGVIGFFVLLNKENPRPSPVAAECNLAGPPSCSVECIPGYKPCFWSSNNWCYSSCSRKEIVCRNACGQAMA